MSQVTVTGPARAVVALRRRPFLGAVQYSQHVHLVGTDLINDNEGKGGKNQLPGTLNTSLAGPIWKCVKCVNASNYVQAIRRAVSGRSSAM
jgi:hypothetical protein